MEKAYSLCLKVLKAGWHSCRCRCLWYWW